MLEGRLGRLGLSWFTPGPHGPGSQDRHLLGRGEVRLSEGTDQLWPLMEWRVGIDLPNKNTRCPLTFDF